MEVGAGSVAVGEGDGEVVARMDVGVGGRLDKPRQPAKVADWASSENNATTRAIGLSSRSQALGLDLDMLLLMNRSAGCEPMFKIGDRVGPLPVYRKTRPSEPPGGFQHTGRRRIRCDCGSQSGAGAVVRERHGMHWPVGSRTCSGP